MWFRRNNFSIFRFVQYCNLVGLLFLAVGHSGYVWPRFFGWQHIDHFGKYFSPPIEILNACGFPPHRKSLYVWNEGRLVSLDDPRFSVNVESECIWEKQSGITLGAGESFGFKVEGIQ